MKTSVFLPTDFESAQAYRGAMLAWEDPHGRMVSNGTGCILWDWSWRALLGARGADARNWLHGMLTANVRELAPGALAPSFVLNARGHILGTLLIAALADDAFVLLTDEQQRLSLYSHLRRYIIREKVEFCDYGESSVASLAIWGAQAESCLNRAGLPTPPRMRMETLKPESAWLLHMRWGMGEVWELASAGDGLADWAWRLEAAGAAWELGALQERARVAWGVPLFGQDIRERDLPQETRQMDALDFHKGCYLGQEIVERIRARGQVHRGLYRLHFPGPVEAGMAILKAGQAAGEITSAARLSSGEGAALGYVRDAQPGERVRVGELEGVLEE